MKSRYKVITTMMNKIYQLKMRSIYVSKLGEKCLEEKNADQKNSKH